MLLSWILGDSYHHLGRECITSSVHLVNQICWFLAGVIPFSVIRRLEQAFIYWVGVIIGLVICGCLLIVVSVSLMFP